MPMGVYVRTKRPPLSASEVTEKFWRDVAKSDGCWEWTGLRDNGYGRFAPRRGIDVKAHRFSWELAHGPLPRPLIVRHSCGNRACVNPAHLMLITVSSERRNRVPRDRRTAEERFWARVQKSDGCWEWTGLISSNGYGRFIAPGPVFWGAHRFSWMLAHGAIPDGRVIMHSCDNRKCVNPSHLSLGTQRENLLDASRKRRLPNQWKTRCVRGHELTPENVYLRPRGGRTCLPCRRAYNSARKKRLRLERAS